MTTPTIRKGATLQVIHGRRLTNAIAMEDSRMDQDGLGNTVEMVRYRHWTGHEFHHCDGAASCFTATGPHYHTDDPQLTEEGVPEARAMLEGQGFDIELGGGGCLFMSRGFGPYGVPQWTIWATGSEGGIMPTAADFGVGCYPPDWDGETPPFFLTHDDSVTLETAAALALAYVQRQTANPKPLSRPPFAIMGADPFDTVGTAIRRGFTMEQIGALAGDFAARLRAYVSESDWLMIRVRNRDADAMVCHSHDFCDANVFMGEAFETAMGREIDGESDDDIALWSAGWHVAKLGFLTL